MTVRTRLPGPVRPNELRESSAPVARRSWLLTPGNGEPLLTGLYGFPWRSAELDAKCTAGSPAAGGFSLPPHIERHHIVLPDLYCTCGIYAMGEDNPVPPLTVPGVPVVLGFVELRGRVLRGLAGYRAQHARIIGPLIVMPGRAPRTARLRHSHPWKVIVDGSRFRVRWSTIKPDHPYRRWTAEMCAALAARYGVRVIAAG